MDTDSQPREASAARELASLLGVLGLVALLAAGCTFLPIAVAIFVNPWLGVLLSLGSFWVWRHVGPPPMPGFLNGILCLQGCGCIFGALILCIILGVRDLLP